MPCSFFLSIFFFPRLISAATDWMSTILVHIDNRKKNSFNNNISSTCSHNMVNFGSLGHPSKFQRVSRLGFVTAVTSLNRSQPNFARCLAVFWAGTLNIHFRGLLPRNGILPGAKFTLRSSIALCYIGNVTAQQSSSGRQPNFAAL